MLATQNWCVCVQSSASRGRCCGPPVTEKTAHQRQAGILMEVLYLSDACYQQTVFGQQ